MLEWQAHGGDELPASQRRRGPPQRGAEEGRGKRGAEHRRCRWLGVAAAAVAGGGPLEGILRISISLKVLPLAQRLGLLSPASELGAVTVTTWSSTRIRTVLHRIAGGREA
jgi:hypothetical protein